jgi:anthranilate phosphoribosyltransferase
MLSPLLEQVQRREDLTSEQAAEAMAAIMDGRATPAQVAGLLMALRMKGERPEEIVGFARTMRDRGVRLQGDYADGFDTCGTGGDGGGTFNVSSVVALVVAGCGVRVAKHGNRAVSSRCGSADLFAALGVNTAAPPAVVERCLQEAGIAFLFAPTFHPAMRHAAEPRRDLGVRTAFNLLGPLTNPAGVGHQLVGVPRPELTELVARSLGLLGSRRAWVVHGADGIDEVSTRGYTKISECRNGFVRTFYLHPSDLGLAKAGADDLAGGDAEINAAIARSILDGERGPRRDIVVMNAAAALFIAGRRPSLREGMSLAAESIDEGRARTTLDTLVRVSNAAGGPS